MDYKYVVAYIYEEVSSDELEANDAHAAEVKHDGADVVDFEQSSSAVDCHGERAAAALKEATAVDRWIVGSEQTKQT